VPGGRVGDDVADPSGSPGGDWRRVRRAWRGDGVSRSRSYVILATKVHGQMGVPVDAPMGAKGDPNRPAHEIVEAQWTAEKRA
jgi:hypothetical protein